MVLQALGKVTTGVPQKLPAGHRVHVRSDVAVQGDEVYWPETQELHDVHVAEFVVVEKVLPATQAAHTAGDVVLQAVTTFVPAAHTLQVMGAVDPDGQ